MAIVLANDYIGDNVNIMKVQFNKGEQPPAPGQFYMMRSWRRDPLLSRPISVFDYDFEENCGYFMYQVVGQGTDKLNQVAVGSDIFVDGPYGNGFPDINTDVVLIGGGIGIAPLHYLAKWIKYLHPNVKVRAYLGYSRLVFGANYFYNICDEVSIKVGGMITDILELYPNETVVTCGPAPMIDALNRLIPKENDVYMSLESRMACGLGACLGCVRDIPIVYRENKMSKNNELVLVDNRHAKICTEGPVFKREVL